MACAVRGSSWRGIRRVSARFSSREVKSLQGDDEGVDAILLLRSDGCGVDEGGDGSAVGNAEGDLFGAHGFAGAERLREGEFLQGDLAPVGTAGR